MDSPLETSYFSRTSSPPPPPPPPPPLDESILVVAPPTRLPKGGELIVDQTFPVENTANFTKKSKPEGKFPFLRKGR